MAHTTGEKTSSNELPFMHTICAKCGEEGHITVERVCNGTHVVTQYCCRLCGHIWKPPV